MRNPDNIVKVFQIGGRKLYAYANPIVEPSANLSLYWDEELNPIQHRMNYLEVFDVLAGLLEEMPTNQG